MIRSRVRSLSRRRKMTKSKVRSRSSRHNIRNMIKRRNRTERPRVTSRLGAAAGAEERVGVGTGAGVKD